MAYVYGIVALIGIFLLLGQFTKLDTKQKAFFAALLAVLVFVLYLFEESNNRARAHTQELLLRFERGENLQCNSVEVDNTNFKYAYGTRSFIAKKESPLKGAIVPISSCKY